MLNILTGVIADTTALFDDLGWEGTLIVLMFVGLCALAVYGISKLADSAERQPRTFRSLALLFVARMVRAFIIFGVVYAVTAGVFGPRVLMILLLGSVGLVLAIAIRRVVRDGWGLTFRHRH